MPAKQARSVCFTLNNPEDVQKILEALQGADWIKYGCVGEEVGEMGTPHLQGYLNLTKKKSLKKIRKMIKDLCGQSAHTEQCKGTPAQNIAYCSKDGKFTEWGERPKMGARTDIANFLSAMKKVRCEEDELKVADEMPVEYARYYKAGMRVRSLSETIEARAEHKARYSSIELRPWQREIRDRVLRQNNRAITWVVDTKGGKGKTTLAEYMAAMDGAFIVQGGSIRDIAFAYMNEPVVIFDLTRAKQECVPYNVMECFKNGRLFSTKYESKSKVFCPAKVLVCSNWEPDRTQLSEDRWDVINFNPYNGIAAMAEQHDTEMCDRAMRAAMARHEARRKEHSWIGSMEVEYTMPSMEEL